MMGSLVFGSGGADDGGEADAGQTPAGHVPPVHRRRGGEARHDPLFMRGVVLHVREEPCETRAGFESERRGR